MKKILSFILISMSSLALVACGQSSQNEKETKDSSKQAVITYSIWDTNQESGMKKMVEKFEEKNPNIKVNVEVTPWEQYWTKLDAGATGGSMPDVFWMHSNESERYMSNNILLDLSKMIDDSEEIDLNNYPNSITELYSYDNKQYAIPKDIDTIGLWYNKTLFDEAGVSYPDESWTWEIFLDAAKKLTDEKKGVYGFTAPDNGHEGYWNFIFQNEGKIMSENREKSEFDNTNTIEAITFYNDLINKYNVSPTADQMSENKPSSFIESGRSAMGLFGSWMLSDFKDSEYMRENTDIAVLPKGKKRASVYNGLGNSIAASTKHEEAATKFVEFLGSEEANLISAEEGSAIPAYKGTAENWANNAKEFNVGVYVDMLDYAVIRPFSKETIKAETVEIEMMAELLGNKKTPEEIAGAIQEEVNKILE